MVMTAIPYNFLERVRLLVRRIHGEVLDEAFAEDVTMTLQFPIEEFDGFQRELQELSAGKLQAEVIETKETIVKV
jgi:putative IMPACT (imprinted ancient) family translation regulator